MRSVAGHMAKILLVEDDSEMVDVITVWLTADHYVVESTNDGNDALHRLKSFGYDLVILDLGIHGLDGLEVCRQYRLAGGETPILMLTGRNKVPQKELGLDTGADDYLTKPFVMSELAARIRALLRRPRQMVKDVLTAQDIILDPANFKVTRAGQAVQLLPVDFALLEFFMRHPNQVFSADALIDRVWHCDKSATLNALRCSVKRLREKLDCDGSLIETVPKMGYRLRGNEKPAE